EADSVECEVRPPKESQEAERVWQLRDPGRNERDYEPECEEELSVKGKRARDVPRVQRGGEDRCRNDERDSAVAAVKQSEHCSNGCIGEEETCDGHEHTNVAGGEAGRGVERGARHR